MKRVLIALIVTLLALTSGVFAQDDSSSVVLSPDGSTRFAIPEGWSAIPDYEGTRLVLGDVENADDYYVEDIEFASGQALILITFPDLLREEANDLGLSTPTDIINFINENTSGEGEISTTELGNGQSLVILDGATDEGAGLFAALGVAEGENLLFQATGAADSTDAIIAAIEAIAASTTYAPVEPDLASLVPISAENTAGLIIVADFSDDERDYYGGAISPDGSIIAFEESDALLVFDVASGEELYRADNSSEEFEDGYRDVYYSFPVFLNNNLLAYASSESGEADGDYFNNFLGTTIVDLATGEIVEEYPYYVTTPLPGSTVVLTATEDSESFELTYTFRDLESGEELGSFSDEIYGEPLYTDELMVIPFADEIAIYAADDYSLSSSIGSFPVPFEYEFEDVALNPDGSRLAIIGEEDESPYSSLLYVYDVETGETVLALDLGSENSAVEVEFSSDGSVLFLVQRALIYALDAETGAVLRATYMNVDGNLEDFILSDDGSRILTFGYETAAIWGVPAE